MPLGRCTTGHPPQDHSAVNRGFSAFFWTIPRLDRWNPADTTRALPSRKKQSLSERSAAERSNRLERTLFSRIPGAPAQRGRYSSAPLRRYTPPGSLLQDISPQINPFWNSTVKTQKEGFSRISAYPSGPSFPLPSRGIPSNQQELDSPASVIAPIIYCGG